MAKSFKNNEKRTAFAIVSMILLIIYSLLLVLPLCWTAFSSLKTMRDFNGNPFGWPKYGFHLKNYAETLESLYVVIFIPGGSRQVRLPEMFLYSVLWAVGSSLVAEFTRSACAYVVAKFGNTHKWVKGVHTLVLILMVVSFPSNLASSIWFNRFVGMYDNLFLRIIGSINFTGPHFLYFYAAYKGVSKEYSEAAYVDGANQFTVMIKVVMPMIRNIFLALFLLSFIAAWNDYSTSLVYMPSYPTVAYGLFRIQNNGAIGKVAASVPHKLAACTLVVIPTLLVFIIFKDKMVGNLSMGGLKG